MAIIDWPTTRAFQGARWQMGLDVSESTYQGFHTGNRTRRSHLADRLRGVLQLPPVRDVAQAAARAALLMQMRSAGDWLRMPLPHQQGNQGSVRTSATVGAAGAAGARSITLANARAGANLLLPAVTGTTLLAPTTLVNATAPSGAADPVSGASALTLTRTASGNHYAIYEFVTAAASARTVNAYVWLRAGTLTGNVVLRLRDGADVEYASATVVPTSTWTVYRVAARLPVGPAANLRLYVDPANDAGAAGDTLQLWFAEIEVATGFDTNLVHWREAVNPPSQAAPGSGAWQVVRSATGNAFTTWQAVVAAPGGVTYTFSVWLRADTYTAPITLLLRDGADVTYGTASAVITGTWQRFSVTATFPGGAAPNVLCIVDPADAGAVGERFEAYGHQLEVGSAATDHLPLPTLLAGDVLGVGGNLLLVGYAGASGTRYGAVTVPLVTPLPKAVAQGAAVTAAAPTGLWELDDDGLTLDYGPAAVQEGVAIPLRQVVA